MGIHIAIVVVRLVSDVAAVDIKLATGRGAVSLALHIDIPGALPLGRSVLAKGFGRDESGAGRDGEESNEELHCLKDNKATTLQKK